MFDCRRFAERTASGYIFDIRRYVRVNFVVKILIHLYTRLVSLLFCSVVLFFSSVRNRHKSAL